jgi:hypothetical protein
MSTGSRPLAGSSVADEVAEGPEWWSTGGLLLQSAARSVKAAVV